MKNIKLIAEELKLSYNEVYNRTIALKLNKKKLFCEAEIIKIKNHQKTKKIDLNNPDKIIVIEMFLKEKNNTAPVIANKINNSIYFVNSVINEYLKNDKFIFVNSKINV